MRKPQVKLSLVGALVGGLCLLGTNALASDLDCTSGTCTGGGSTAIVYDGVTYASFAGALWTTSDNQSTGSGVIDSFVRLSTNKTTEQGMNTSGRPLPYDENNSGTFTHDIQGVNVPVVTIDGSTYYEFLLDINQQSDNPYLSLDQLQLCSGTAGDQLISSPSCTTATSSLVYNLDASADNRVLLDYNLNSGSGSGDLFVYIPTTGAITDSSYVYLYSMFGATAEGGKDKKWGNNDGYEEWAVRTVNPISPVPEPASVLLFGSGLLGLGGVLRRRLRQR